MITLRHMADSQLDRIAEIDRSEHVTQEYAYRRGSLERRDVDLNVPTWSRSGDHEHSVRGKLSAWQPILDRGAPLVGAFDSDALVGFAICEPHFEEGLANFAVLHVSRSHRRLGIGSLLAREVVRLARSHGARRLYVSATSSGPTVEFYRSHGFAPTDQPNRALFALEPLDIHMTLEL
jgi:ribosomal protein S18 acetylase RimI-like enzyme